MQDERTDNTSIIMIMCKTLDVTQFRLLDKETQKLLLDMLRKKVKNTVIKTLINNYISHTKLKSFNNLLGPSTFSKFTKDDITVYVIGEIHIPYDIDYHKCSQKYIHISEFIKYNLEKTYKPIDLFLETSVEDIEDLEDLISYEQDLIRMRHLFGDCIVPDKSRCKYLNTSRVHYFDLRHIFINSVFGLSSMIRGGVKQADSSKKILKILNNVVKILKNDKGYGKIYDKIIKQFTEMSQTSFSKKLKKYQNNVLQQYHDFFNNKHNLEYWKLKYKKLFLKKYEDHIREDDIFDEYSEQQFLKLVTTLAGRYFLEDYKNERMDNDIVINFLLDLSNRFSKLSLIETYSISRMFRKFKQIDWKISITPRNIIFYAGNNHSQRVGDVLKSFGFRKIEYNSVPSQNAIYKNGKYYPYCTNISDIKHGLLFE